MTTAFSTEVPMDVVTSGAVTGQLIDGCPTCLTQAKACYLRPVHLANDDRGGVVATYAHGRCGERWTTSWAQGEAPGVGIYGGDPEPSPIGDTLRGIIADLTHG